MTKQLVKAYNTLSNNVGCLRKPSLVPDLLRDQRDLLSAWCPDCICNTSKSLYLIDMNRYVGYKLTGRITRDRVDTGMPITTPMEDSSHARKFSASAFVDYKLRRSFIAHLEGEAMNAFVPSTLVGSPATGQRESFRLL